MRTTLRSAGALATYVASIAARLGIGRDRVLLHVRRHGRDDLADWYAA